jgi:hypothetical protein
MEDLSKIVQGELGEAYAEYWFRTNGYRISKPDCAMKYDFIADKGDVLSRISVKTCRAWDSDSSYRVELSNKTGWGEYKSVRPFAPERLEILFVITPIGVYLIPTSALLGIRRGLRISPNGGKYEKYRVCTAPEWMAQYK